MSTTMNTKPRTPSKAKQQTVEPPKRDLPTWATISSDQVDHARSWFDPLCERLDNTTGSERRALCREVAQGYKQIFLPNDDMPTLIRWVESYHCPLAAGYLRVV